MTRKLIIEVSTEEDDQDGVNILTRFDIEPAPNRGEKSAIMVIASRLIPLVTSFLEGKVIVQTMDEMDEITQEEKVTIQ